MANTMQELTFYLLSYIDLLVAEGKIRQNRFFCENK